MTPAQELMLAYLRNAHERNGEYQRQIHDLHAKVARLQKSRRMWRLREREARREARSLRASVELWKGKAVKRGRRVRDLQEQVALWRHRALIRQEENHADSGRTSRRIAA